MIQKKSLRVLIVDDSADDCELMLRTLRNGGYDPDYLFAEKPDEMKKALDEKEWDLILCDYSMPEFDGLSALNLLKTSELDIPFILISGAIGEELAVEAMKAGANDYLMKNNLQRLLPAIERELREAKKRRMHEKAENERDRLLMVVQKSLNEIYIFDTNSLQFTYLNHAALNNLGYFEEEMKQMTPLDIMPEFNGNYFIKIIEPMLDNKHKKTTLFTRFQRKDGSIYPIELYLQLIDNNTEPFFVAIGFDQTDRIEDAKRIKKQKKIADEHALSNQFKSEFLANMSHELRTPLNSILLLSKLLNNNKEGNLTHDQLEYINAIHNSGNRLLSLVNEVLDLSKIEAGEMELILEYADLKDICNSLNSTFTPVAKEKGISIKISTDENLAANLFTDRLRLEQILYNLLSNAFKFTEKGSVELTVQTATEKECQRIAKNTGQILAFKVKDTGIGIPKEKHDLIFEGFRQADGSTQRNYGGTGLGLTISNKLTKLLGGSLTLESEAGKGSTFTLFLPANSSGIRKHRDRRLKSSPANRRAIKQNLSETNPQVVQHPFSSGNTAATDEELILIAVRDMNSAESLVSRIRKKKLKPILIQSGEHALDYAEKYNPRAILIDVLLPEFSGWTVAKQLAETPSVAHIPVWMYAETDEQLFNYSGTNIHGYIIKPVSDQQIDQLSSQINITVTKRNKTLLVVDDSAIHNEALKEFSGQTIERCLSATSGKQAYEILESNPIDCVVLDMNLPDAGGFEVLKKIKTNEKHCGIPVIIYTGQSLSKKVKEQLLEYASAVIFKNVGSYRLLLEKVGAVINGENDKMPGLSNTGFTGKKILIADDDPGSFFSISSVLKSNQMQVLSAANGREALNMINNNSDIDAVLMDIMMPVMNGYKTIMEIRKKPEWKSLPIFAITAKAMDGDREKCLKAGATDYISKPLDTDKLLSILNIWL